MLGCLVEKIIAEVVSLNFAVDTVYWTTKKRTKYSVRGPGAQKNFRLSSRTPRIPFKVISKTNDNVFYAESLC